MVRHRAREGLRKELKRRMVEQRGSTTFIDVESGGRLVRVVLRLLDNMSWFFFGHDFFSSSFIDMKQTIGRMAD